MVFDWDDFEYGNHRLDLLERLKQANPAFKCTLFAIPGNTPDWFWADVPDWCELALHGWQHPTPRECEHWTYERALAALDSKPERFVDGWKSPGWQISDGTYEALVERGWWLADQPYNDGRRPAGLPVHRLGDGNHWHGHIQNVVGNGLEETFDTVVELVKNAESFQFISEVVRPWQPEPPAGGLTLSGGVTFG